MNNDILFQMKSIDKIFSHVHALNKVDFEVRKGEVHALLGENGAGKSTLIKILTGVYPKDGGEIYMEGKAVDISSREAAQALGISVIFQELSLVPTLSVYQNIILGKEKSFLGFVKAGEEKKRIQELINYYGFSLGVNDIVETLSVAQMQLVEILKALASEAKLIIMDEPAAGLNDTETAELTETIRRIRDEFHVTILLVEHDMSLVMNVCDTVCAISFGKMLAIGTCEEIKKNKAVQEAYLGIEGDV